MGGGAELYQGIAVRQFGDTGDSRLSGLSAHEVKKRSYCDQPSQDRLRHRQEERGTAEKQQSLLQKQIVDQETINTLQKNG